MKPWLMFPILLLNNYFASVQDVVCDQISLNSTNFSQHLFGDGIHDDTVAIQSIINLHKSFYLPSGTYLVSALTVKGSNFRFYGPGILKKEQGFNGPVLSIVGNNNYISVQIDNSNSSGPGVDDLNDAIQIRGGNGNIIENCKIAGNKKQGNGIAIHCGSQNTIKNNIINSTHANGIYVEMSPGDSIQTNENTILNNTIVGTITQDGIFVTANGNNQAKAGVGPYIINTKIIGNTVVDAGDSGIESGVHTVNTIVKNNNVKNSLNPGILFRDAEKFMCYGNAVSLGSFSKNDAIAVIPQIENATYDTQGKIYKNFINGNIFRSGIYVGQQSIVISENSIENDSHASNNTNSILNGNGILLGVPKDGELNNVAIIKNNIRNFNLGINTNYGGGTIHLHNLNIRENNISGCKTKLSPNKPDFRN